MAEPALFRGRGDNGGVHFNGGINNKAAYLMVDGATFNGQTISPARASSKAAKVYYESWRRSLLTVWLGLR